jgi:hypothetical protein
MTLEIHVLVWNRRKNVAGLNWFIWILNPPLLITGPKTFDDCHAQVNLKKYFPCSDILTISLFRINF